MDKEKKIKRLVVDIEESLHNQIKMQALWRSSTIKKYIIESILERMKKDSLYQ